MDRQDIANALAGTKRLEDRSRIIQKDDTKTISGTLVEDTSNGIAKVYISDDVTQPDEYDGDGTIIELPTSVCGEAGDEVLITARGSGLSVPIVTANPGFGDKIKTLITEVEVAADTASQEALAASEIAQNAAAVANDGARLVLTSTRGQLFKNGAESTILQVAIFPNGGGRLDSIEDVRSRFGNGAYIEWRYMNDSDGIWHTMVNTDSHLSQGGMWCTIGPEDVDIKTTFEATLNY